MLYWIYLDRRTRLSDRHDELKAQTFHLFPERWEQLYAEEFRAELGMGEEQEQSVTDVGSLDEWFAGVQSGEKRTVNGGEVPPGMGEYWRDWQ